MTEKKNISNHQIGEDSNDQREFKCKCTKIYKSYPALYTHIKNKHPNQIEQYKLEAKKPKQGQIQKGRPKKHRDRPVEAEQQGELLNIIELGILEIQQNIRKQHILNQANRQGHFQILQGNSKLKPEDLQRQYEKIKNSIIDKTREQIQQYNWNEQIIKKLKSCKSTDLTKQKPEKIYKQDIYFKNQLIQHFPAYFAAKILIQLQIIQIQIQENKQNRGRYIRNYNDTQFVFNDDNTSDKYEMKIIQNLQKQLWKRNSKLKEIIRKISQNWNNKLDKLKILRLGNSLISSSQLQIGSITSPHEQQLSQEFHSQQQESEQFSQ